MASATLGSGAANLASAGGLTGRPSEPARSGTAAALSRAEWLISDWERPDDVLAAIHRVHLVPAERAGQDAAAQPPVFTFAISEGRLGVVVRQFEAITGIVVTIPADVPGALTSSGVSGTWTAAQALERLLAGTGLSHRFTSPRAATLEIRVDADTVEVRGALPASTSVKFPQPLLDTPQTVTVVPSAVIEAQGAASLRDVLRNVPGITMQAGEGGGGLPGDTLSIRGFSASGDVFVDGIRDVGAYTRDAFNLEQVEVIKGPASTFGGRGSTGGAINLATKSPGVESLRQGTFGLGTAGSQRVTVDVNESLGSRAGGSAVRLNAMWQDAGVPGRDEVNNASWAVAPSVVFGLRGSTRVAMSSQHVRQDNVPDYGLPWGASTDPVTGEVFETGALGATPAVDQSNFYGLRDYDYERIDNDVVTARIDHDMTGRLRLTNSSRYGETFRDSAITAPRPPRRQLQRREMRNEVLANQTNLSATASMAGIRHEIIAGLELAREETYTRNSAQSDNQPETSLRLPDPADRPLGPMPELAGNPGTAVTLTQGAYVFDTASIGQSWEISGGLRWDRSDVRFRQTTVATGAPTELARTDGVVSWRGGVVYKPSAAASLYAGVGTSFNPASDAGNTGTSLSEAANAANNVNLEPERSRNAEAGAKWALFGERLAVNGAIFHTVKTNARTRNLNSDPYVLAGRHRVQGVELGASGEVLPGFSALASFAWMDSEIEESANPAEEGRDLALTPRRAASVWATWQVRPRFSIGGGTQYTDAVFRNATAALRVPGYWLANAMAAYEVNAHLTLRVNATNLGDVRYVDRVGGGHYIPGPRRAVQITTDVDF